MSMTYFSQHIQIVSLTQGEIGIHKISAGARYAP